MHLRREASPVPRLRFAQLRDLLQSKHYRIDQISLVGAGTVHSVDQAKSVADAGAKFVVSPGFNPKTVSWCIEDNTPIFPGISSPTDLEMALEYNLDIVKFFPAEAMGGVKTLKAFHGPYDSIRFMPTGGISPANLADYLSLPYVIACGGSWFGQIKSDRRRKVRRDYTACKRNCGPCQDNQIRSQQLNGPPHPSASAMTTPIALRSLQGTGES